MAAPSLPSASPYSAQRQSQSPPLVPSSVTSIDPAFTASAAAVAAASPEQTGDTLLPRVTRSAARRAAEQANSSPAPISSQPQTSTPNAAAGSARRKRKQPPQPEISGAADDVPTDIPSGSRPKRQKVSRPPTVPHRGSRPVIMSEGQPPDTEVSKARSDTASKKRSTRRKKSDQGDGSWQEGASTGADIAVGTETVPTTKNHRSKKTQTEHEEEPFSQDNASSTSLPGLDTPSQERGEHNEEDDDDDSEAQDEAPDDDETEQMRNSLFDRLGRASAGFPGMRAFGGLMGGIGSSSRFKEMLDNLRSEDPTVQMEALSELSNFLLISTEDNLAGHFIPDQFVGELVKLMQPHEITGEENPEMMLLACRCLANMMEALPPATASVVYGGAVPVLCSKLLEINFIDVAEQALSTLEKISVDFPSSIVREGGLGACLNFLDFFATGTQRTAVTTAANCCRSIPEDSFPVVRDVMPVLLNVLSSSDQKVVEQGSLCVSRIVESFKNKHSSLEELVSADLLQAILRLLMPGTTNLIPADIHTKFVRVLALVAGASPARSASLLNMDVVDTLYQILTGVSPPANTEDVASHIDGVVIMQSLIRKQRDQVHETLSVICEMLPGLQSDIALKNVSSTFLNTIDTTAKSDLQPKQSDHVRRDLVSQHEAKLAHFASILLPTLTHAYMSTVNLGIRQKVLAAQLKMLSNLDVNILEDALRAVPFASHLASILSQKDHPILVLLALVAAQLLSARLGHIYDYQFCREGVVSEISKLASRALHSAASEAVSNSKKTTESRSQTITSSQNVEADSPSEDGDDDENDEFEGVEDDDEEEEGDDDIDEGDQEVERMDQDDESPSASDSSSPTPIDHENTATFGLDDAVTLEAKRFMETFEHGGDGQARSEATAVLSNVRSVATDIQECYASDDFVKGATYFRNLAKYFGGDPLQSITSAELRGSDLADVLLEAFTAPDGAANASKSSFLSTFMSGKVQDAYGVKGGPGASSPFTNLVQKLQDLLSRAEHFEVVTVHSNSYDSSRSSAASMLAKQLRLKLVADENSDIPRAYRNIMVSIHAIATFKALDDYLRPRLSFTERGVRGNRHPADVLSNIAAAAGGMPPEARQRLLESGLLSGTPPEPHPASASGSAARTRRRSDRRGTNETGRGESHQNQPAASTDLGTPSRTSARKGRKGRAGGVETPTQPTHPLECADETHLRDVEHGKDDDDDALLQSPLGALAAGTTADQAREETPDPSAVNMEVASTGKVTARQEDGSRIPTPSQSSSTALQTGFARTPTQLRTRPAQSTATSGNPTQRTMSYAAAIQSTPQDWHIEFSINGQPINNETTIYRAVHYKQNQPSEPAPRSLWSAVHLISFKRVSGPPPEPSSLSPSPDSSGETTSRTLPPSLHKNPLTTKILRLLAILHEMNSDIDSVLDDHKTMLGAKPEPASLFVNTKLTAKLNRQLEEPLVVASNCLPGWSEDLARLYPFLFPFETRHLFLQSTSFGYSRSMTRWQSTQGETSRRDRHRDERPFLGRLQRQKVRISRSRLLESAMKVMELYGASPSVLEVEYFEEVGTGLGPTLEFYSNVSKEFSKKKLRLWRGSELTGGEGGEYAYGKNGLFPLPLSIEQTDDDNVRRIVHLFRMMGKFVARALLDSRIIDISFNPMFFKYSDDGNAASLGLTAIKSIDGGLYSSLKMLKTYVSQKKRIEEDPRLSAAQKAAKLERIEVQGASVSDLGFDFTLPGDPQIELVSDGSNIPVSIHNVEEYLNHIVDFTVNRGVRRQIMAFRSGFSEVFPYSALRAFTPAELVMLFGRIDEDWSLETLTDSIKADHGYNMDSKSVKNLLQIMSELDMAQRRDFLQFITGSPKLPIGGFKSLTPMFTVVCKPSEPPLTSDDFLPSVMTCVNYLKLPDYSDIETMKSRLFIATKEGQGAFHLS